MAARMALSGTRHMYWTVAQLVAHQTSNGCSLAPGDLLGSGTISAPTRDGFGSLLETTSGGNQPLTLPDGDTRTFLADGDEVILRGRARRAGAVTIGFGGTDGTSGVEGCTTKTYSGPDVGAGTVTGNCTDKAGNVSETDSLTIKYDATAPAVTGGQAARVPDAGGWSRDVDVPADLPH